MEFVDGATLSSDGELTERSSGGISRRSVMKAGAVAAWSVPLVQVVAAAPANAACSGTPVLDATAAVGSRGTGNQDLKLTFTIPVKNVGGGTTSGLKVSLYPTAPLPAGWTVVGDWGTRSGSGTQADPFVWSAPSQATCGGASPTLIVTVTMTSTTKKGGASFEGTAFAPPATAGNIVVSVPPVK
jgi:hypothetical protein